MIAGLQTGANMMQRILDDAQFEAKQRTAKDARKQAARDEFAAIQAARAANAARHGGEVCDRCGGAGGWKGWPGFTCYKCGGQGWTPLYKAEAVSV